MKNIKDRDLGRSMTAKSAVTVPNADHDVCICAHTYTLADVMLCTTLIVNDRIL